jgi:SPP1 gp7 family putative phage head morphogenesis protein
MSDPVKKFLIAQWRERVTPKQINKALNAKTPGLRAVEMRYNAALQRTQREINKQVREKIQPLITETLREDALFTDPLDAFFKTLSGLILEFIEGAGVQNIIKNAADAVMGVNFRKYDKGIPKLININAVPAEATSDLINSWVLRNTELITNVNAKQLQQLQGIFRDTAFSGTRAGDLRGRINKVFKDSRNNVSVIARDQVGKLNGQLDQLKQQNAGVEGYYWRTSRDERVRSEHAHREGEFYRWDRPPVGGHPGQPIQCRCTAEAAVDQLLMTPAEFKKAQKERKKATRTQRKQAIAKSKAGNQRL